MRSIKIQLMDVPKNAVLAEDIYWRQQKLLARGYVLKHRDIDLLKRRNIQFVYIERYTTNGTVKPLPKQTSKLESKKTLTSLRGDLMMLQAIQANVSMDNSHKEQYLQALAQLKPEVRYGAAMKNNHAADFVCELFSSCMQMERYRKALQDLKDKDYYTYLHAIDVFTISLLFMKHLGLPSLERVGVGFLLHDIGKLNIPNEILKKRGKLSKPEFDIVKRHTVDGYHMLNEMGAQHVAYLALQHHEKADGSGYPQQLKLSELQQEVSILQLVDMYSAITLARSYKGEKSAAEAIKLLFQDKHLLDEKMLEQFVEFLGIYPESALVQLSNGTHAVVEKVNERYPLLPTVRIFETGVSFTLPLDFQLTITKLISYHVATPEQLFLKFSEYLMDCKFEEMESYYLDLKERYRMHEWFTHIYIPIYQIFQVLKMQNVVSGVRVQRCEQQLAALLLKTNLQLRQLKHQKSFALIVVSGEQVKMNLVSMLEGILHTEDVYGVVVQAGEQLDAYLAQEKVQSVFVVGDHDVAIAQGDKTMKHYYCKQQELEQVLLHFSSIRPLEVSLMNELARYEVG